jgi:hypothetical protein
MRILHRIVLGCAVAMAGLALPAASGAAPAGGLEPGGAAAGDAYIQELLSRLNSPDPAKREAAQKQMAGIAGLMQSPEAVKQLQELATEPELKELFGTRVAQLKAKEEEKRIRNLPGISLKVSNAPAADLIGALNAALEAPMKLEAVNSGARRVARGPEGGAAESVPTWTLEVKDKPFWEVFTALQEQQPMDIQNTSGSATLRVSFSGARGKRYYAISGPAILWLTALSYSRSLNFPTPAGGVQAASMGMNLQMAIDPRIRATRIQVPTELKAVDDEGRNLARPNPGGGSSSIQGNIFNWSLNLNPPERLGRTMTLTLDGTVMTTVGDMPVAINDLQNAVNKPVTFLNRTAKITRVSGDAASSLTMQLNVQPTTDGAGDSNATPYTVSDATGKVLYSASVATGTTSFGVTTAGAQGPFKLEFRVAGRNAELPVHFEFKDVPLP